MITELQEEIKKLKIELESIKNKMGNITYDVRGVMRAELQANSTLVQQSEMQYGMYTALCVETIDIWKQNKIRYFTPHFHNPKTPIKKLPWAGAISAMGGFDDCGLNWVPPAGSTVCLIFETGNRQNAYYIGTTWNRDRGPAGGHNFGIPIPEYYKVWEGHRKGYLVGPDDESQVFPPWNTESYNGFDLTSILDFADKPEVQKIITYPNIYGFKTPEKHMIKMVDGDPKCNRRWKRFEIMSGCGNWIMMKDDHLHYAGQWSHPECGVPDDDVSCVEDVSETPEPDRAKGGLNRLQVGADGQTQEQIDEAVLALLQEEAATTDITPKEGKKKEDTECEGEVSNSKIIGGHPATGHPNTKHYKSQKGANAYFKHKNECRPYKGPGTPQNNTCDLPQSGIQFMSISGHTFVMDDSVEEPSGNPEWERSMKSFDFGCNNHYVGRTYWKSATGHYIEISDVESPPGDAGKQLRGEENYIRLKTATGNFFEMNDHTEPEKECPGCPPNIAGQKRGFTMRSTSNHSFEMIDWTNEQCSPCRREGGVPTPKAKKAFVKIRTGYGLEILMKDEASQEETQRQHIQIFCPQYDNKERGPHIHRYQEAPSGPGLVFLRVGGNYVVMTYDNHITVVGDFEKNPSNLIELVSKVNFVYTKDVYINVSDQLHLFYNPNVILLLAGEECSPPPDGCQCGGPYPCVGPILVYDPCNNVVRLSSKVIGSYSQNDPCCTLVPFIMGKKCPKCD
jgi:hypothetical protein